jgi:hypothetical protein
MKSMPQRRVLVTGAGGFIGHHLVTRLKEEGYWVRGADLKAPEYAPTDADEFGLLDLRERGLTVVLASSSPQKEIDHYLELLFIPLIYLVASDQWFSRRARILIGAMFLLSLGQNLIFVSWLRSHIESDWRSLLLAVTVLKAGPLLVMLTFVWRHYPELFDSYAAPVWNQILIPARERRS